MLEGKRIGTVLILLGNVYFAPDRDSEKKRRDVGEYFIVKINKIIIIVVCEQ